MLPIDDHYPRRAYDGVLAALADTRDQWIIVMMRMATEMTTTTAIASIMRRNVALFPPDIGRILICRDDQRSICDDNDNSCMFICNMDASMAMAGWGSHGHFKIMRA